MSLFQRALAFEASKSRDNRKYPGIEAMGSLSWLPSTTKSGTIKSFGVS